MTHFSGFMKIPEKPNHTQQIIQDAIEGAFQLGLVEGQKPIILADGVMANDSFYSIEHLVLQPSFWQAVGKTRGWGEEDGWFDNRKYDMWQELWHRFIDHLAEGDDYETALNKL